MEEALNRSPERGILLVFARVFSLTYSDVIWYSKKAAKVAGDRHMALHGVAGDMEKNEQYVKAMSKLGEIGRQLHQRGGYPYSLEILNRRLQELIEGELVRFDQVHTKFTVNYDLSLEEALALGGFSRVDPKINPENFPSKRKGCEEVEARILKLFNNKFMAGDPWDEVNKEISRLGFRHATLRELLAFRAEHKAFQKNYQGTVLAEGDSLAHGVPGVRQVPIISWNDSLGLQMLLPKDAVACWWLVVPIKKT